MNNNSRSNIQISAVKSSWLFAYLDILTLLLTLFVIMIAYASFEEENPVQHSGQAQGSSYQDEKNLLEPGSKELHHHSQGKNDQQEGKRADYQELDKKLENRIKGILKEDQSIDFKVLKGRISIQIQNKFLFNTGSSDLSLEYLPVMKNIEKIIELHTGKIRIEGHADDRPIKNDLFASNWYLSYSRALSIALHLIEQGFDVTRFEIIGFGSAHPIAKGDSEEDLEKNRRVNIVLETEAL